MENNDTENDINPINFDMSDIAKVLNNINNNILTFEKICLDKIIVNFINWANKNKHHQFPKSENAWKNLLDLQFSKIRVFVEPHALYRNINSDFSSFNIEIQLIVKKIIKFINKPKNQKLDENSMIKKIGTFSHFTNYISVNIIYNELIQKKIIVNNFLEIQIKRKRKDVVKEVEYTSNDLYLDSYEQLKSKKRKLHK